MLDEVLAHLRALVACDTRNPPRAIDGGGIFAYLQQQLPGFACTLTDHGAGAVSLLAVRGTPRLLFNVHLDTVPDAPQWSASPFALRVTADRAIGLGACDIKGAAAALVAAATHSDGACAFLFTSDEEANDARCVPAFLRAHSPARVQGLVSRIPTFNAVIVAEPTHGEVVLAHRGISSVLLRFAGVAGHASAVQQASSSAVHQALRWGARALDWVDTQAHQRFAGLTGLRFNIGRIEGGIKANVIAPGCELRCGLRPLPSMDTDAVLAQLQALADPAPAHFEETFRGPSLPAGDIAEAEARRLAARDLADELGLPVGNAVDFWTEAALFSQAGCTSFVFGPGDIAQAHSADEWVALDQLAGYAARVHAIIDRGLA
ncbi:acetylornithine deacetylase [Metallibacterium scheffleri]|uniref:N-acetyl-L-citrulline deacetylase n=1 Tax=Metallibacterium scheffleri TaxID=993689 RepID=A0A4S3KPW1_9GAMM|nr:acetylornithine deacetylase [Metallibacterium scheffleri]